MPKARIFVGLALTLCAFAMSASSASALFENKEGQGSGSSVGAILFTIPPNVALVQCASAQGEYHIQEKVEKKGEDLEEEAFGTLEFKEKVPQKIQEKTTKGPHLELKIGSSDDQLGLLQPKGWHKCTEKLNGGTAVPLRVRHCNLQLEQESGQLNATGSLMKDCILEQTVGAATCRILIKWEQNQGLKPVTLTNKEANVLAVTNVKEGVLFSSNATCTLVGIKGGETQRANFEGTVLLEGVKAV